MTYQGNNFKKILSAILADKHKQPIVIGGYFHMPDGSGVDVEYSFREHGESKGHSTRIPVTKLLEFQMNFSFH